MDDNTTPDFAPAELNLTMAAAHVVAAHETHQEALKDYDPDKAWAAVTTAHLLRVVSSMWEDLTGLSGADAVTYAYQVHRHPGGDIRAAVAPF